MLESEAMALLVSAVPSYKNRDAALALAGSALAVLQDAGRYAAQLGDKGVAQVRQAWLEREERLGALEEKRQVMDMVRRLLKLKAVPRPDDAADALALPSPTFK